MSEIQISATGHLTRDPELNYTPGGKAVAKFQIAVTPRRRDAAGNWVDDETTWLSCEVWEDLAEHAAESLVRGTQVFVQGTLKTQRWDDRQTGEKRERIVVQVREVGPSLRFATAKVQKAQRQGAGPSDDPYQTAVHTTQQQLGGQVVREDKAPF